LLTEKFWADTSSGPVDGRTSISQVFVLPIATSRPVKGGLILILSEIETVDKPSLSANKRIPFNWRLSSSRSIAFHPSYKRTKSSGIFLLLLKVLLSEAGRNVRKTKSVD